ncbi:hypothetical protein GCM10017786_55540 [Amycolatopsis deserti]|uniref:Uncharacterized protein n=1 Tax=Amycolatopsis deserti TaxID=185696 RepID=A0ABQ3JA20_9PSEU|nr:hypothetical protein GCM10017786_55540 [Amycolatopsis deserti]
MEAVRCQDGGRIWSHQAGPTQEPPMQKFATTAPITAEAVRGTLVLRTEAGDTRSAPS